MTEQELCELEEAALKAQLARITLENKLQELRERINVSNKIGWQGIGDFRFY